MDPAFQFTAFLATTLDGFIARTDGGMDFLDAANATIPPGEDCGIAAFLASVDAIVMGRHTFLHVLGLAEWPYGDIPLCVVSGALEELPEGSPSSVRLVRTRSLDDVVRELAQVQGSENTGAALKKFRVYVDGGEMVRSFIKAKFLGEVTLTVIPKLIGEGRRLFGGTQDVDLVLKECTHWGFGFVQSRYELQY